jgi:TolB protein
VKTGIKYIFILTALLILSLFFCMQQAEASETLHIDIYGPGQPRMNLLLATPLPLEGQNSQQAPQFVRKLQSKLSSNFEYLPFLRQMQQGEILLEGPFIDGVKSKDIDFDPLRMSQVDLLLTLGWRQESGNAVRVELRLFDAFARELLVGRGYVLSQESQIPEASNRFSAEVMQELTGNSAFFRSRLAYVRKSEGKKEVYTSTPQGDKPRQISDFGLICLSPAWSWDGSRLAFTLLGEERHELIIWHKESGQTESIPLPANTIISPVFSPGGDLVISADPKGNPDIFTLDKEGRLGNKLVDSWAIDISPDFEASGKKMVFVSSRLGNPHIFLLDMEKEKVSRISYEGTYNTNPSISPDGRFVAYSRQTEQGHRIILHDLQTGQEKQLTQGPGDDEEPAWGPDSFFLAFTSNRSGEYRLYVTTRHGDEPREIPTGSGEATFPAWNPSPR